jgi:hypothetical protein
LAKSSRESERKEAEKETEELARMRRVQCVTVSKNGNVDATTTKI